MFVTKYILLYDTHEQEEPCEQYYGQPIRIDFNVYN